MENKAIGIRRESQFSPNHIGNDRIIFDLVTAGLISHGIDIMVYDEHAFLTEKSIEHDHIFTMGRNKALVNQLKVYEEQGKKIFNSGFGIEKCYRINMVTGLINGGVPYPKSIITATGTDIAQAYELLDSQGVWIKRGDFHAIHREDVSFVSSREEAQHIVNEYAFRGIQSAVLSEHLAGDLVKFYGVRDTDFFHWFYPYDHNHHKYALYEDINGKSAHYPFNTSDLQKTAETAAKLLEVFIYGGDAIIDRNGNFHIIDLNDWPSFAPCREEATAAITQLLLKKFADNQPSTMLKQ
ncbi:hypothetical protein [Parapedobacter tibetensis]|uniref:hypothetical protein n=1 Tax=Parapedobacter tibetensis TaxID=2972951 RepID=UPI00214DE63C|nr:hypothetical protein [Parapedobacter tibetensis]